LLLLFFGDWHVCNSANNDAAGTARYSSIRQPRPRMGPFFNLKSAKRGRSGYNSSAFVGVL
jgi:hypothetical protein